MKAHFFAARHLVVGIGGRILTLEESGWLKRHRPQGVILFGRNLGSMAELRELVTAIRATATPPPTLWLDQEGGRVQRIREPLTRFPSAMALGNLYQGDPSRALVLAGLAGGVNGRELAALGIGVNCAPVLDIREPEAHSVIGDRAFGDDPQTVVALAGAWLEGLRPFGVMAVGKHFPGHGAAKVDSHRQLPVVLRQREQMERWDLAPFRQLSSRLPAMMTAHLMAPTLDEDHPATWSRRLLHGMLRQEWGYRGVLVSDAIEMGALEGKLDQRTRRALEAGCDLVLCCTGRMEDNELALEGAVSALETSPEAPFLDHRSLEDIFAPFRLPLGDLDALLADSSYRAHRGELEALAEARFDKDPTLAVQG